MDVQQTVSFRIYEEFGKRRIEFAYPTQTLYLNKVENGPYGAGIAPPQVKPEPAVHA